MKSNLRKLLSENTSFFFHPKIKIKPEMEKKGKSLKKKIYTNTHTHATEYMRLLIPTTLFVNLITFSSTHHSIHFI